MEDLLLDNLQRPTLALVSELLITAEPFPVRFMYRTVQANLKDTGWRLFSGYETPEQAELKNLRAYPVEKFVNQDPQLLELLQSRPGAVWERRPNEPWSPVTDFEIPTEGDEILAFAETQSLDDLIE